MSKHNIFLLLVQCFLGKMLQYGQKLINHRKLSGEGYDRRSGMIRAKQVTQAEAASGFTYI